MSVQEVRAMPYGPVSRDGGGNALMCQRSAFSLPLQGHYLNCAYMAPLSHVVEEAANGALRAHQMPWKVAPSVYFDGPDALRQRFAELVNIAESRRVAVVPSVSYAMATVAKNVSVRLGQNIVVIGDEFPGAVLVWRRLAYDSGVELRTVAGPGADGCAGTRGAEWNARLHEAIDANSAVVVLSHVHWSDGTMFDVAGLAERARAVGAVVVVDGTQSVGALPFDVAAVQPDMLVCAGYKWLMGGYGLSVAYFGPRFDNGTPLEDVWTSQLGARDFAQLSQYRDAYVELGARYDGGQRASFVLVPMLTAAIEQLLLWRPERIQQYCETLLSPWGDRFAELGVLIEPAGSRSSHLFGLRLNPQLYTRARESSAVVAQLRASNVHVSPRGDVIRVSPNVYNVPGDFSALHSALSRSLGAFKSPRA